MSTIYDFYRYHIHPLAFNLVTLEQTGVLLDEEARERHRVEETERAEKALRELEKLAGRPVNPNSSKQVQELLYDQLKLPTVRSKDHKITTDEEALRKLKRTFPDEQVIQLIITYRKATKIISTYLDVKTGPDNRMHSSYNPSGTETGRLSSSRNIHGEGTNLQNIPAGKGLDITNIRDIFIAPPGKLLLKGDLKQAESMVVAWRLKALGYPQLRDKYQDPLFDIHRWAAAFALGIPESAVKKRDRDVFKIVNHSGNYMSGPGVLVKTGLKHGIDFSYAQAKQLLEKKRIQMPELYRWWNTVAETIKRTRTMTNCFGRQRLFFGRVDEKDNDTIRKAVAWEPQSTIGDLTNTILRRFYEPGFLPPECFPVLQVHDEIVLELPEDQLDNCVKAFKEASHVPLLIAPYDPLVIPIELSCGKNWRDMNEIK